MKPASCHPERKHKARGMCAPCWRAERMRTEPEFAAKVRDRWARYNQSRMVNHCCDCGRACRKERCRSCWGVLNAKTNLTTPFCAECKLCRVKAEGESCPRCLAGLPRPSMQAGRCITKGCTLHGERHGHCRECRHVLPVGEVLCHWCQLEERRRELSESGAPAWQIDRYRLHNPAA